MQRKETSVLNSLKFVILLKLFWGELQELYVPQAVYNEIKKLSLCPKTAP